MDVLLIAGLWLDTTAWDDVVPALAAKGHRGIPVALPGQGDGNTDATLQDQLDAVLEAIDAIDATASTERPVVVGHSAACTLAWLAADARPDAIARVGLIGGFPSTAGEQYAAFFPLEGGVMAFPGWEPFAGADTADMSDDLKSRVAGSAHPVPGGVAEAVVAYRDERRHDVPVFLMCPEFSPAQADEWIEAGDLPELADAKHLDLLDLDSGHWPMFTAPEALAQLIADEADEVSADAGLG